MGGYNHIDDRGEGERTRVDRTVHTHKYTDAECLVKSKRMTELAYVSYSSVHVRVCVCVCVSLP